MHLDELETYRLTDALRFHDRLNPRLWGADEKLRPEVRQQLLAIADDFREFLGIDVDVQDITISGSNAAYTYTDHSDIDLHLVVDLPRADHDEVYRELFDAKKYQYNDRNDFKIGQYDVELYVQDPRLPHHSQGIYSVKDNDWIQVPRRRRPDVDDVSVRSKYQDIGARIDQAIASKDLDSMDAMAKKIKAMRAAGLADTGEFGPENLAFKILRNNGTLDLLTQARKQARDQIMSLDERRKKARRKKFQYGSYGGLWFPGYHYYAQSSDPQEIAADGGGDGGGESIRESRESQSDIINRFADSCANFLGMETAPKLKLRHDPEWTRRNGTFGRYTADPEHQIELATHGRHIIDILRTLAHEMTHARQNEVTGLPDHAGETGSQWEDQANAMAGRIMRHWAESEPEMFGDVDLDEGLRDRAGALAAAACIAGTPGCATTDALKTVQTVGRTAQSMERMGRAGAEEELKQKLRDYLRQQRGQVVPEDYSPDDPPGPEFPPTMPQGTVRVDVSDMYDWYKLGQHISDLEGLGRHDFGKGPPSTILAFGDEDLEHKYIQNLKRTGLDVTDIDPASHARKPGQKTDPTYNVAEASGYIPTAKERNDPRFSMALTVDVHPGQTGKEANKLALKTDSQGRPALLMKKLNNLLEEVKLDEKCWDGYRKQGMKKKGDRMVPNCVPVVEDEELTEVKMSPAEFQKFLKSPAAEGIRAGFEAELIFRDTQSDVDGGESEPDYDADERAYSIDDIINFFQGGDGGIGPGTARRLQDQLMDSFSDYAQQQFADDYFDLARFQEWADDTIWPEVDDQYRDQARDDLGDEATDEQVEAEAVTLFHDDVERDWDRSGEWYNRAYEELYDEYYGDLDQSDWLDQADLRYMSNVAEEYGLDWPYWTDGSGSGGTRDWQEIANGLERVTGMPVRVSSGYHGAARRPGQYIIEPDSSLDSDDSDDYGLEVVSPPLPLPEAVEQLRRIIDWANSEGDAYTNSSTGLHMGVSLPFKGGDVDPVKLILFMGDQNVLETFGRESNTYARSAYERLESKIRGMKNAGQKQIAGVMELMKKNLIELADREFKKGGLLGDKYVSVHPQDGYIEFRGPGGDYLAKSDEIDGVLENTMLRLAYAMSIAGDPAAARQEYAKKLYKMLTGYRGAEISKGPRDTKYQTKIETEGENPFMRLFADYSAGMLSGEELKAKWADTVLAAERGDMEDDDVEDVPIGTPQEYEVYDRATGEVYTTFQARNDDEAVEQFSQRYRAPYAQRGLPVLRVKAPGRKSKEPKSRRAELAKRVTRSTRDVGEQLWRVNHHSSQRWVVARSQAEAVAKAIQQDRMFDNPETRARIATDLERQQWQQDQERERERQRDREQDAAQIRARLGTPQPAGGEFTGAWEIRDAQGRELHRFGGVGNSQADANRFAARWLGMFRPDLAGQEVDVVPVMRQGVAEGSLNEFSTGGGDDGEDPFDAYPCYDCGSTIFLHHTKSCDLAEPNAIRDLPEHPGTQHWTGEIPKGLHPIPGLQEGVAEGKIKLSTDPNWYGAEVGDYKASGPIVNIPANRLVGFEPDDKMNQPASKANVKKIVAGLKQGAKLPPLLVRQYKNGYQVLDGHHRFWAYKLLGVKSIPAQVVPAEDIEEITKQGVAEGRLNEDATRAEAQAAYMQGQCMILAVAINQLNPERYPIGYIWEYNMSAGAPDMQLDDDEWEYLSPQEQEEISKDISRHSVVHAYVRDRDTGEYIDARGRHKTLPNLWGRLGQTRFEEFPGTARELIDITAHGDWDEVGEQVSFKRGQPAFDSLAGPAGIKRAQDYAIKYLGVEVSKNKTPGTDQQGVSEGTEEINWVKPNFDFEWHEVEEQSKMKQVPIEVRQYYQKHFPNKEAWLKSVQNGKVVVVNPDHNFEIRNAPHDKQSLLQVLAPTGHEGPIGPAKAKRVNALFDKGGPIEMPIILKTNKGLWLIGGKTRLGTANYIKGIPAKVWMIGGEQGVREGSKP